MISAWTERGNVLGSYRDVFGVLTIKPIGTAEYAAFLPLNKMDRIDPIKRSIVDISTDFPGWCKLIFADYDSRKAALESTPSLCEADVSPVRRFMSDHLCHVEAPRRGYLDIETDSRQPFSQAIEGDTTLLSFAIVDEEGHRFTAVLDDMNEQAEAELWAEMWRVMGDYDQIPAWGGDRFDFAVTTKRSELLARRYPKIMQPFWEHRRRLLFIDHLACFKRHHMAPESGDDKTSMKLNDVCQSILGEGKHDFNSAKTWEAWAAGGAERQRLVDYNLQDTALLPKLEAETGYLTLQQTLNEITFTFGNSHGLKPMPQVDGYMLRLAHERKTHLPSKKEPTGAEKQYEGAFVMDPTKLGIHRTVHVCDFKSLYPSLIRTWNMSAETKGLPGCTAFGTKVQFGTEAEGMLATCCRSVMEMRAFWQREYAKDPNNKNAERKSKGYKIFNNSIYGVCGSPWSRYYDVEIVESVTLSGKHLLMQVIAAANAHEGWESIYGDTDSVFVSGPTVEEFDEFVVKECNGILFPRLLDEAGCHPTLRCIELAYEKAFDRLVFPLGNDGGPVAKRYAGSYLHVGRKPKKKPEIRGLEFIRGDSIRYARRMQRAVIEMILGGQDDPAVFEQWILNQRGLFFEGDIPAEDICKSAAISMALDKYKVNSPHVRIAKELEALGEDMGEGTRISYVVIDGTVSPAKVISTAEYDGGFDRHHCWNKMVYPATLRVLAGAFPNLPWSRWIAKRPKSALAGQLSLLT